MWAQGRCTPIPRYCFFLKTLFTIFSATIQTTVTTTRRISNVLMVRFWSIYVLSRDFGLEFRNV